VSAAAAARDGPSEATDGLRDNPAIAQLAGLGRRFVGWREAPNPDPTKPPRKVPIRPRDGRWGSSTDPDGWGTLAEARAAVPRYRLSGVGVVLGDGLAGVDFDTCLEHGTGTLAPWARSWVGQLASYAEVSPSGTGVKALFFVDPVPELRAHKRTMGKGANGAGHPPAIEFYTGGRFFTLTGRHLAGTPDEVTDATEAAERLAAFVAGGPGDSGAGGRTDHGHAPELVAKLLEDEPELKAAWASGEKLTGGNDDSASGLDYSLVVWLASRGYGDAVIEAALRHYPHGQIRKLDGKAADRRIKKLLAEAAKHRARAGDDDAPWPEPDMSIVDPHRQPAPKLPLEVFGPFWARWIKDAAAAKSAPPDFVALPLLGATGGMLALSRQASPWTEWTERRSCGPPAWGRRVRGNRRVSMPSQGTPAPWKKG
jgi:hypothetical protein